MFSAAQIERANTHILQIAEDEMGSRRPAPVGWRFGSSGALVVFHSGNFHDHRDSRKGKGALALIRHFHPKEDTEARLRAFLAGHPGNGDFTPGADPSGAATAEDDTERTAFIRALWDGAATESSVLDVYLTKTRKLPVLPEDRAQLRWLERERGDEGAMVAAFTDSTGAIVALQLTYITPAGEKSPIEPARRTLRGPADWSQRGFIQFGVLGKKFCLVDGLEKGLAARLGGAEWVLVMGGGGRHFELPPNTEEGVVARDADPPGSPADQSWWRLVVRLLGQGLKVDVTHCPNEIAPKDAQFLKDADDLYRLDPKLVPVWLNGANLKHGRLGSVVEKAILDEASRLDGVAFSRARRTIAASLIGMQVGLFDDTVAAVRKAWMHQAKQEETLPEEEPWPDPVTDIGEVMDEAATELRRYVVMDEPSLHTAVTWSVFAHIILNDQLKLNVAPRLAAQSSDPGMGKTTLLEGLACLTPRPNMVGSTTASGIFRTIEWRRPTYLLDEIDNLLHHNADPTLKAILNSGHRKRSAYAERVEKRPDGSFKVLRLKTWAAIATAGIGELYPPLQSRSITITLAKATGNEQPEHMIDAESEALFCCRRKFARWAQDLPALPEIDRPKELLNRKGDNWYPLRQIAHLAGGKWPERIRAAATRVTARPNDPKGGVALLEDVWTVFYQAGRPRLVTGEIIAMLIGLVESPWGEANHGKPINPYYLREAFKPYFKVWEDDDMLQKAREWREPGRAVKGYVEEHFEDAWFRHLQKLTPTKTKKYDEEAAKQRAESAAKGDENDGIHTSPYGQGSTTSPQSTTKSETYGASKSYAEDDGFEGSTTEQKHRRQEPEHHRPEETRADGGDPCRRSKVDVVDQKTSSATVKDTYNQDDNPFVGDVGDVGDATAKGEYMAPPSDPVSHLRGAQYRQRAGEVK
jgi:hypothetical protein